jgi:hypothetical protein
VTRDDFDRRCLALGLNNDLFSKLTSMDVSTVRRWGKPRNGGRLHEVPGWVPVLLDAWERRPELLTRRRESLLARALT